MRQNYIFLTDYRKLFQRLGPKEHSSLFTGSPIVQAKRKSSGGKVTKVANKSNHPALAGSPLKSKGSSIRKSNSNASQSAVKENSGLKVV